MRKIKILMLQHIQKRKATKIGIFKSDYQEMIASYKREQETSRAYNGRQLLELIQNCDDQKAETILIRLDKENERISISNDGEPFSEAGYNSLFIDNLSSKRNKKLFIGNKGLGFRSILTWSDCFSIASNGVKLQYSILNAKKEYEKLFDAGTRLQIQKEHKLKNDEIPVSILSCPDIGPTESEDGFATTIEIEYRKQELENIVSQLKNLNDEILLFLHHIKTIKFLGIEKDELRCSKRNIQTDSDIFSPSEEVFLKDQKWLIFEDEGTILKASYDDSDERDYYQIKLAYSKGISRNSYLYSFFPTRAKAHLPYLLHATFELDSARNHINDSVNNKFIAAKMADLIIRTARFLSNGKADWTPLRMLQYHQKNDELDDLGFYDRLDESVQTENIFPCIDGEYRKMTEVVHISNNFVHSILNVNGGKVFKNLLIPIDDDINLDYYRIEDDIAEIEHLVTEIKPLIDNNAARASLIYNLSVNFPEAQFDLLLDDSENEISKDSDVFSPINKEIAIPSFCNVTVINQDLYNCLLAEFGINTTQAHENARMLQRKLSDNYKFSAYEPAPLAAKIIASANNHINEPNNANYFKEAIIALHNNYKLGTFSKQTKVPAIYLFNKNHNLVSANKLYLSSEYPSGYYTEQIFEGIYTNDDYISPPSFLGLLVNDITETEEFFVWLGVNKFAAYQIKDIDNLYSGDYHPYFRSITSAQYTSVRLTLLEINNIAKLLPQIGLERFILWALKDSILYNQLKDNEHTDIIKYTYYSSYILRGKPSFIKYKINQLYDFSTHIIDPKYQWINKYTIDYNIDVFKDNSIKIRDIESVLILLGAKESFATLPLNKVYDILQALPDAFPDGKGTQTIYRQIFQYLDSNNAVVDFTFRVFASDGERLSLYQNSEVYFSDKFNLPSKLRRKYPMFNFPQRAGGSEAIKIFGLNDLKNVKVEIIFADNNSFNGTFNKYFESLKPSILTLRINRVLAEASRIEERNILNKVRIHLCDRVCYSVDGHQFMLEDNEYISCDNIYYIKAAGKSFDELISKPEFSQIISEILISIFDIVNDKAEFQLLLKGTIGDTENWIQKEYGEELFRDAKILLNRTSPKYDFYCSLCHFLDIIPTSPEEPVIICLEEDKVNLDDYTINYNNLNAEENIIPLKSLFSKINCGIESFNKHASSEISYSKLYREQLNHCFHNNAGKFKSLLWQKLKDQVISEKSKYLVYINEYELYIDSNNPHEKYKYDFEIQVETILNDFLQNRFSISIHDMEDDEWGNIIASKRDANYGSFSIEDRDLINSNHSIKSIMYFDLQEEEMLHIRTWIDGAKAKNKEADITSTQPSATLTVVKKKFKSKTGQTFGASEPPRKPYAPNINSGIAKKHAGDSAEQKVFNKLIELYGRNCVVWSSRENEGLHYDIRYRPGLDNRWRYVEVKSYNYSFIITADEVEFGRRNAANYEIWLVDSINLYPITDFFIAEERYKLCDKTYEVFLEEDELSAVAAES